ncbi:unnamed protein product [Brugia timori]|uniref:Uncharacterized protein n=1 Tax=Brugia timori TaxID=42155 RepID=A0A3P7W7B0_9BILA|nr:unnamed protein product [Brugia timori]
MLVILRWTNNGFIIIQRNAADESTISLDGFSVNGIHIHLHGTIVEIERLYQNLHWFAWLEIHCPALYHF